VRASLRPKEQPIAFGDDNQKGKGKTIAWWLADGLHPTLRDGTAKDGAPVRLWLVEVGLHNSRSPIPSLRAGSSGMTAKGWGALDPTHRIMRHGWGTRALWLVCSGRIEGEIESG
jgi:hypothetical protein